MTETYAAMRAVGAGRLEMVRLPLTEPTAGNVRIRVEACGICHTDASTIEGRMPGLKYPRVPGHEAVGKIDALGSGVDDWGLGQRVGVGFYAGHCGTCSWCRRGEFVHCLRQSISGVHQDGGYAEVMFAKASGLVAIPEEFTPIDAAPLLCAGLTTFNALRKSRARAGDLVAIQGIGGLGHLGVQYAHRMGFKVVAIARDAFKASFAIQLGAHRYIDSVTQDPGTELKKMGGAKVILATASNSESQAALLGGLAPGGELIVLGVGGDATIPINGIPLLFGTLSVVGHMTGSPIESEDTLAFSAMQGVRATIETFPLAEAQNAYRRMLDNEARYRIVLVMDQ